MKISTFTIAILSLILFCSSQQESKNIKWLQGKWIRLNDKPEKITYELWENNKGIGYTLQGKDTVFKETLRIVSLKGILHLSVKGVNAKPTLFKFISQTENSFVAENPENEFPKTIKYYRDKKQLKAEVSDDIFKIDFVFNKLKE